MTKIVLHMEPQGRFADKRISLAMWLLPKGWFVTTGAPTSPDTERVLRQIADIDIRVDSPNSASWYATLGYCVGIARNLLGEPTPEPFMYPPPASLRSAEVFGSLQEAFFKALRAETTLGYHQAQTASNVCAHAWVDKVFGKA